MATTGIDVRSFRRSLRALERQVELSLSAQTECCGVTPAQCHLLLAVEEAGEPSVGDLASELELDASTLSRTVDRLVKTGLLDRREDPDNRRRQIVSLSDRGSAKVAAINGLCDSFYGGLLASLPSKDAKGVARLLPRFVRALGEWRKKMNTSCCLTQPAIDGGKTP